MTFYVLYLSLLIKDHFFLGLELDLELVEEVHLVI